MITENEFILLEKDSPEWSGDFLCLCETPDGGHQFYKVLPYSTMFESFEVEEDSFNIIAWAMCIDAEILKTKLLK